MSTDRLTDEQIAALRALAEQATPGPWAYEATAEKSNDWAVGQAFDEHGHPLSGRLDTSVEWLEDRIITRRLIGESEDAPRLADAAYIAAANPAVLLALLAEVQEWRAALQDREAQLDALARALAEVQASQSVSTGKDANPMRITVKRLSSGYWHVRGVGPCNWAQPQHWPCDELHLRASAMPEASEAFIRAALVEAQPERQGTGLRDYRPAVGDVCPVG